MIDCRKDCPNNFDGFGGDIGDRGEWIICAGCTRDQLIRAEVITQRDKNDITSYKMENEIMQQEIDSLLEKVGEDD